jgi:hypothetical protein
MAVANNECCPPNRGNFRSSSHSAWCLPGSPASPQSATTWSASAAGAAHSSPRDSRSSTRANTRAVSPAIRQASARLVAPTRSTAPSKDERPAEVTTGPFAHPAENAVGKGSIHPCPNN